MEDQQAQETPGFLKKHANAIYALLGLVVPALMGYPAMVDWMYADKSLSYSTNYNNLFNSPTKSFKLYYEDISVDDITSITVSLSNVGEESIKSNDIIEPIKISLASDCNIINADVVNTNPLSALGSFRSSLSLQRNTLYFKPKLINSGDSLSINIISSGCINPTPSIEGRVDGVKDFKRVASENSSDTVLSLYTKVLILLYTMSAILWAVLLNDDIRDIREVKYDRIFEEFTSNEERKKGLILINDRKLKRALKGRNFKLPMLIFTISYLSYLVITN